MADIFTIDPATPAGVAAPILSGGYYPSIDRPMINGMGLIVPWGGGSIQRELTSSAEKVTQSFGTPITQESQMFDMLTALMPTGDIINYNFEGLVGPMGPMGPPGPMGISAPPLSGLASLDIPSRVLSDGLTPGTPADLTATAGIQYILLEWTANTEPDMDRYEVWRHTSDDSGSASKIADAYQTLLVDGGLTAGTAQYYWVKAVDHLGNTSAFSSSANATPTDVESSDIVEIAASKVLISGAVYLSNWSHGSDVTKIDGGDIYTSSITASQISANTITASEIAATTITYSELRQTAGSEAVNTGCIRDDATRMYESSTAAGPTAINSATETTVISIASIAVTATPVILKFSSNFDKTTAGNTVFTAHFYEGAVDKGTRVVSVDGLKAQSATLNFQYTPSASTYTYTVKVIQSDVGAGNCNTSVLEVEQSKGK
jgi:hypothetical protein